MENFQNEIKCLKMFNSINKRERNLDIEVNRFVLRERFQRRRINVFCSRKITFYVYLRA